MVRSCVFCLLCSLTIVSAAPLIKRIAIVGSGTAGLGLAAALKQLPSGVEEVVIFEGRDDFLQPSLGGGVQINGGAAVMEKLGCLPDLERVAQRMGAVRSRNNNGIELLQLDIFTSVLTKAKDELCASSGTGAPMVFSIMRDALQSILYDATQNTKLSLSNSDAGTPSTTPQVRVRGSSRCVNAKEDGGKVILTFSDGHTGIVVVHLLHPLHSCLLLLLHTCLIFPTPYYCSALYCCHSLCCQTVAHALTD